MKEGIPEKTNKEKLIEAALALIAVKHAEMVVAYRSNRRRASY